MTVSQEIKKLNEIKEDAAPFNNKVPAFDWGLNVIKNRGVTYFKGASLCFGFGLFVIYFMQNNFYPEFDLFGFGLLLVTSSVIGIFVTGSGLNGGILSANLVTVRRPQNYVVSNRPKDTLRERSLSARSSRSPEGCIANPNLKK
ncbi:hypothetical protein D3C84_447420 [compost metagenome]